MEEIRNYRFDEEQQARRDDEERRREIEAFIAGAEEEVPFHIPRD